MMSFRNDRSYLFWFETSQEPEKLKSLEKKLKKLGVNFEVVNGMKRPEIVVFKKRGTRA